mmetsp:Transcript_24762/g.43616  ORF Transcript_24762/g.43616 Transcript_24762/m.43616 type:complete len:200 (+) Transcript_24762:359-958(+)|eukprot:CAMPEP_0204915820 /NCGR_PEP_ID=MMETSP1397-20131031/13757_1 /ASSEMBLY_ACC=CAM_ASM_000891 /TAXON_ID=49980 /ORGANISM="Climacostomum Climacostomum virens, Strain Stock W-24" /LENGTH=199 /DNA_ID=CAMNT_0052088043 /DNA_START=230 /DNA_END=829 /DNA_ORIENTATION=-
MYDRTGTFFKIHSPSRRLVPRFFVISEDQVWYVKDANEIRQAIETSSDISEVLAHLSQAKSLPLSDLIIGPKQLTWFRILSKRHSKDYTVFPWKQQMIDELYGYFSKRDQPMHSMAKPPDAEQITDNVYTITLPSGNVYCGELDSSGRPHSDAGREFREDGSVYFGSFRDGLWHGAGVLISPSLDMEYAEFCDGCLTGL